MKNMSSKIKVFFAITAAVIVIFPTLFFTGCASGNKEIGIAECENGKIVAHGKLDYWVLNFVSPEIEDYYEAVPDPGYYFETWVFLDKNRNEIDISRFGVHIDIGDDEDPIFDNSWSRTNFICQSHFLDYFAYIKAVFTNDESKLVDVIGPDLEILTNDESIGALNYQTNTLPAKKVDGTLLWKYVILEDSNLYFSKALLGVGWSEYGYDTIHIDNYSVNSACAYLDYEYNRTFENRIEKITMLIDKVT